MSSARPWPPGWHRRSKGGLDQSDLAARSTASAWQLRDRTSDREKFFIAANYALLVSGNLEEARQTGEAWARTYPRDAPPHFLLSGYPNKVPGRYAIALAEARKGIELDPDFAIGYYNIAVNLAYLGRLGEAAETLRRAAERGLEIDEYLMLAHDLAFLRGDQAEMEGIAARGSARSGGKPGHRTNRRLPWPTPAASNRPGPYPAVRWIRRGRRRSGKGRASGKLEPRCARPFSGTPQKPGTGRQPHSRFPGTARWNMAPLWRCPSRAISSALKRSRTTWRSGPPRIHQSGSVTSQCFARASPSIAAVPRRLASCSNRLAPTRWARRAAAFMRCSAHSIRVYVRGEAFLAARQGVKAAAEFRKILDHPGIAVSDPIGALARLQLASALALSGDRKKAKAAYEDFLTLWKDADPDIPVLSRAKAEYAGLGAPRRQ